MIGYTKYYLVGSIVLCSPETREYETQVILLMNLIILNMGLIFKSDTFCSLNQQHAFNMHLGTKRAALGTMHKNHVKWDASKKHTITPIMDDFYDTWCTHVHWTSDASNLLYE